MKTITIRNSKPAPATKARSVSFTKRETEIALTMKAFGFSFGDAIDYLDGIEARKAVVAATKAASRIPVDGPLAAAILADYADGANKKMKDFTAFQIASISRRLKSPMVAQPESIARLQKVYGIE